MFYRHVPTSQYYDLTLIKKSNTRAHDELQPRPEVAQLDKHHIPSFIAKEGAYSSHRSRFQVFPFSNTTMSNNIKETSVIKKTAGNFGRVESIKYCYPHVAVKAEPIADENLLTPGQDTENEKNTDLIEEDAPVSNENALSHTDTLPRINYTRDFFSRHSAISEFHKRFPSTTPSLGGLRFGRRPADWHLLVANHTVGR